MRGDGLWQPRVTTVPRLVGPVPVDPTGTTGPTKSQAAGPGWRRTSANLYVPADVDASPEQRILEQVARCRGEVAVTGWAACRLHGAAYFDGLDGARRLPVPLVRLGPGRIRSDADATLGREPLDRTELVVRHGMSVVSECRAVFDAMREPGPWWQAVLAMDMAAAAELASVSQMRAHLAARTTWRRSRRVERALDYASERSASPPETRMRLVWRCVAGLPPPLVNREVFTRDGRLVAVVDLLDPVAGLVGEYDGADHLRTARRRRDSEREERLRALGLEYVDAVAPDLLEPGRLARRILSVRDRARFEPEERRRWTIVPPAGWPHDPSLDERLFEREMARAMIADVSSGRRR